MPDLHFRFTDGVAYVFDPDEVTAFREKTFGRMGDLGSRVSTMFCVTLIAYELRYGLAQSITQALKELEAPGTIAESKAPTPFQRPPLTGLWHKHFFDARFLPGNYRASLSKKERLELAWEVVQQTEGMETEERAKEMVRRVWSEPLDDRLRNGQATGEWIVYLPRNGKNYYLACSNHRKGQEAQQQLLEDILTMCSIDFPDLQTWLDEVKASQGEEAE